MSNYSETFIFIFVEIYIRVDSSCFLHEEEESEKYGDKKAQSS